MTPNRIALVIGNSDYAFAAKLSNPPNDAADIASALQRIGFHGLTRDGEITDEVAPILDLDYREMRRLLAAFAGHSEPSVEQAILFYAGHGIEVSGQNYLIPVDAELANEKAVEFQAISLHQIQSAIQGPAGLQLIILDACRDNPFRSRMMPTRTISRGLSAVDTSGNMLVAYSAKHGTVASDGKEKNSPYTSALRSVLEQPGLEISDLFREVKSLVLEKTGGRQEPYLYGSLGRRREYLVPPPEQASPVVDDKTVEHTHWTAISKSLDPSDYEDVVSRFPNGLYASMARRRVEALIGGCNNSDVLKRFLVVHSSSPSRGLAEAQLSLLALQRETSELISDQDAAQAQKSDANPPHESRRWALKWDAVTMAVSLGTASSALSMLGYQLTYGFSFFALARLESPFQKDMAPILAGLPFALAFTVLLKVYGGRGWALATAATLAFALWPAAFDIGFLVALGLGRLNVPGPEFGAGAVAGAAAAAALACIASYVLSVQLRPRRIVIIAIVGAVTGVSLGITAAASLARVATPWLCFLLWQIGVLCSISAMIVKDAGKTSAGSAPPSSM